MEVLVLVPKAKIAPKAPIDVVKQMAPVDKAGASAGMITSFKTIHLGSA